MNTLSFTQSVKQLWSGGLCHTQRRPSGTLFASGIPVITATSDPLLCGEHDRFSTGCEPFRLQASRLFSKRTLVFARERFQRLQSENRRLIGFEYLENCPEMTLSTNASVAGARGFERRQALVNPSSNCQQGDLTRYCTKTTPKEGVHPICVIKNRILA